jgi:hypothetical protein
LPFRLLECRDECSKKVFVELVYSKLGKGYQKSAVRDEEARIKLKMRVGGKILRAKMAGYGGKEKQLNAEAQRTRR